MLGVVSTASDKEITRAYRKLAKQHHPDANPGSEERFKEISAAYDVLGDPEKRKEYDEVRTHGPIGGFGQPGGGTFRVEDMGDLSDLFGGLFGGGRTRTQRGPRARCRHGGAAPPLVPGRRARGHHVGERAAGGALLQLPRQRGRPWHLDAHLPALWRDGQPERQPGSVLPQHCVPRLHGTRHALRHAVPGLPGHRYRAEGAFRQGPHPTRGRGRAANQGQGPWRARAGHGAPRRPLRGRPRGPAPRVRPQRAQPHDHGADHVPRGRAQVRRSPCPPSTAR